MIIDDFAVVPAEIRTQIGQFTIAYAAWPWRRRRRCRTGRYPLCLFFGIRAILISTDILQVRRRGIECLHLGGAGVLRLGSG
jgi:hypothetical protein